MLFFIAESRGEIIDSQSEVDGYPQQNPIRAAFIEAEWNLDRMEPRSDGYPGQKGPIQENQSARDAGMRQ